ncbi:heme-binding protein [bacterium]|nr:heme-binding protein [bacterium]
MLISAKVERKKQELLATLAKYDIEHTNEFELLVYDSPYKVLNRRNEVIVILGLESRASLNGP